MGGLRMGASCRKRTIDAAHHRGGSGRYTRLPSAACCPRDNAIGSRISRASEATAPKDSEVELPRAQRAAPRLLIQRLERMAALIDELDGHIERMDQRIMTEAMQRISGAGVINLIAKADSLSSGLKRFAASLRNNELRRKLPEEALDN